MSGTDGLRVGDGSVLVPLHDGVLDAPADLLVDSRSAEATAALQAGGAAGLRIDVNAFLLRRDGELILVDAGCGTVFGPALGQVPAALAALGIGPDAIGTVLLTHPHGDHVGGLLDDAGEALRYPGAAVYCPAADIDHFGAPGNEAGALPRQVFGLLGDRLRPYGAGAVLPGIEAVLLPGHSPGHSGFLIGSDTLVWGDVLHAPDRQARDPGIGVKFDADPVRAAATRRDALTLAAEKGWTVAGMHLPRPGFARVVADGTAFRVEPVTA